MNDEYDDEDAGTDELLSEPPSKSAIKRQHHALQQLAQQLCHLPPAVLTQFTFGAATWAALNETTRIKDQRALGRHYKRVANCLLRENTAPVQDVLAGYAQQEQLATARHHLIEQWRQRLLTDGDAALNALVDDYPHADRQQLRALIRAARTGQVANTRRLWRAIRAVMDTNATDAVTEYEAPAP